MGVWGTAIFSDDTAADTRDAFTDFVADGLTPTQATERLVAESAEMLADEDDRIVFWLALAATQWKLGRLITSVHARSMEILDSGADLHRWQDNSKSEINQRRKNLEKLREQLSSSPPKQRKLKPVKKSSTDFRPGDIAVFRLNEQTAVRFCVLYLWGDRGGIYAHICLLGLDDGKPFKKTALTLADTLKPHYTMLSHEPAAHATILRRDVQLPERNSDTLRAWNNLPVRGHACRWEDFATSLQKVLPKLGRF